MSAADSSATAGAAPPAAHRHGRWIKPALAAIALIGLSRLFTLSDLRRALTMIQNVGWPLVLVLVPTPLAMMLDAYGWRAILATLGHDVRWTRMVELRLSVEAIVLALPGGSVAGEAAKVALLDRRAGVPLTAGATSLALTKLMLIASDAGYLLFAATALALAGHRSHELPLQLALAGAAFTGVVALVLNRLLSRSTFAARVVGVLSRLPVARWQGWWHRQQPRFAALDQMARRHLLATRLTRLRCFLAFLLEWFTEGLETFIILRCLGLSLGAGEIFALDGVGSLLRAVVVVVPAGLGVQDATQIMLLAQMGIADPIGTGAAFVFTKRTKEVFWIVMGLIFLAGKRDLWRRRVTPTA